MDAIDAMIAKLSALNEGEIVNECVKQIQAELVTLNTQEQLYNKGINSAGAKLKPKYSPTTIRLKKKTGLPTDRVTLFQTGRFHGKWRIHYYPHAIEILADPIILTRSFDLTSHLAKRYGPKIFGLTAGNLTRIQKKITPLFTKKIREKLK